MDEIDTAAMLVPDFDELSGNWLCLDFTHTLQERYSTQRLEQLRRYDDLVAWGIFTQLLTHEEARQLLREAQAHPEQADAALQRAIETRELLYRVFYAIAGDAHPDEQDMALLNALLAGAMPHTRLVREDGRYTWDWASDKQEFDVMLWHVIRSAADLLTSEKLRDVRACAAEDCRWLFLDTSKNHTRRWCDMQTCGNQAKARRHYSRKKAPD